MCEMTFWKWFLNSGEFSGEFSTETSKVAVAQKTCLAS